MAVANETAILDRHAKDLQQRLRSLVKARSQADLARRVGMSAVSVSRYLRGTRVPAEFCSALIENLGLNPSWLMVGEGVPYLADVSGETGDMAGTLLELVQAMSAMTKLRLGSLAGKRHALALRELNDALGGYERLRERLNNQTRDLFRRLLDALSGALDKHELSRAQEVFRALRQVARLCDDPNLRDEMRRHESKLEYLNGNQTRVLELLREAIRRPLANGTLLNAETCEEIQRACASLNAAGRGEEALRISEAALALAPAEARTWPAFSALACHHGVLLTDLGSLRDGLAMIQDYLPTLAPDRQPVVRAFLARAMLMSGALSIKEVLGLNTHPVQIGVFVATHAIFLEDVRALETACGYLATLGKVEAFGQMIPPQHAPLLLQAIVRQNRRARDAYQEHAKKWRDRFGDHPVIDVLEAQERRLLGDTKGSAELSLRASSKLKAAAPVIPLELMMLALHQRNICELGKIGLVRGPVLTEAQQYFAEHVNAGYLSFATVTAKALPPFVGQKEKRSS